jgi:O-antigen/teichoic acid export membrane protein
LSFSGVNWFYLAVLERELAFRRRFVAETTRTVVFSTCALSAAALDAGVWALVIGQAAGHIANGLVLLVLAPYRVRFGFDPSLAREMLRSGRGFVAQDGAVFLQENADYVVVGQFLGTTSLGIYSMAYRQAELPRYAIAEPLARVTFPAFSRMLHRGEDVRGAYLSALRLVAFATIPLAVIMSAAASPFVSALFGENWRAMIPVLTLLGLWGAIRPLQVTAGWYLNSTGHAGVVGRVAMSLLVPLVPALAAAAAFGNTATVALVMVAHLVVTLAILLSVAQRLERTLIRAQLRVLRPVACAGALAWLTTRLTADATTDGAAFASLTMASLVGAGTYLMVLAALDRALLGFAWHQIRRSAGRTRKAAPTA